MDPFTTLLAVGAGLALKVFGAKKTHDASKEANAAQIQSIQLQQQLEDQRRKAMELDASRKQLENIRNAQKGNSLALAAATNQGAQFGSSLQGGYGQIAGEEGWNATGVSQQLELGRNAFDINSQISQQKILQAKAGQKQQDAQGISSLGGDLISSAGNLGKLTANKPDGSSFWTSLLPNSGPWSG